MSFIPFVIQRARRNWQILVILMLGVFFATTLLASSPILVETVVQIGLSSRFNEADLYDSNIHISTSSGDYDLETFSRVKNDVNQIISNQLSDFILDSYSILNSRSFYPWQGGRIIDDQRVNFIHIENLDENIDFLEGDYPEEVLGEENIIRGVIGVHMANEYDLSVGDSLPLSFKNTEEEADIYLEITGIVEEKDPVDAYWFGLHNPLRSHTDTRWEVEYSILLPMEGFFSVLPELSSMPLATIEWNIDFNEQQLNLSDIPFLQAGFTKIYEELKFYDVATSVTTKIPEILAEYEHQVQALRAPLYLLSAEIVLLTLYYVVMVSTLSVQQVEREFSILVSRGASRGQIFQMQLIEAGLILVIALISGPGLAVGMVRSLMLFGPIQDVLTFDWALTIPQSAYLAAFIGAISAFIAVLLPARNAINNSIISHQMAASRKKSKPLWQRVYLDVFILIIGLVFLIRFYFSGGLVAATSSGANVDWLLLVSPIALLIGSATILLRLFPIVLKVLEFLTERTRGIIGPLSIWQSSRNQINVVHLVLLLTLAMALGLLSTGLNETLGQSEYERAKYASGGQVRLVTDSLINVDEYKEIIGDYGSASAWRGLGTINRRPFSRFDVLAIEPYSFAGVSHYRDDFSEEDMGLLLGRLDDAEESDKTGLNTEIFLPGKPGKVGLWVYSYYDGESQGNSYMLGLTDAQRISPGLKLMTNDGYIFNAKMKVTEFPEFSEEYYEYYPEDGWYYFEADLPELSDESFPLKVHTIWFQNKARTRYNNFFQITWAYVSIDDLIVEDSETGERQTGYSFESITDIWVFESYSSSSFNKTEIAHNGEALLDLRLYFDAPLGKKGLQLASGIQEEPLVALANQTFLDVNGAEIGKKINVRVSGIEVNLLIVGVVKYFPTMYDQEKGGFIITQRDKLMTYVNKSAMITENINEIWLNNPIGVDLTDYTKGDSRIEVVYDVNQLAKVLKADPMALGLRSVTYFGFILTTILAIVGFVTYFYISAKRRAGHYGVLRSIGLSPGQLYTSLMLEQVLLIITGLILGTGLGVLMNQLVLPNLPLSLAGKVPIPPFIPFTDWGAVFQIYLLLMIVFFFTLGIATLMLWRARMHRVLRIGEE